MRHKRIKKILSLMLSLVLFAGCVGAIAPVAELQAKKKSTAVNYDKVVTDGKFEGSLNVRPGTGDYYYYNITMLTSAISTLDTALDAKKIEWGSNCWNVDVLINGEAKKAQVNCYKGGNFNFFGTYKDEYAAGTVIKVLKGKYVSTGSTKYGIEFTQDYSCVWTGKSFASVQEVAFKGTLNQYGVRSYWGFKSDLPQKIEALAGCTWNVDCWKVPVLVNGEEKVFNVNYDGGNTAFDFFTDALKGAPTAGTTFKIPAGTYLSEGTTKYAISIDKDYTFTWDGTKWGQDTLSSSQPVSFTGTIHQYGKDTYWGIKAYLPQKIEALAGCVWNEDYWKVPVLVNGEEKAFNVNYDGGNTAFDFFTDALKGAPTAGTTFKIPAGTYLSEGTTKYAITIDKDYAFTWDGTKWGQDTLSSSQPVSFTGTIHQYGKDTYWGIKAYLPQKIEALAGCVWNEDYWKVPVLVNGEEKAFNVNYDGGNTAFDFFTDALKGAPTAGTTFKISAGTYLSEGTTKYAITIDKDYAFTWDGTKWGQDTLSSSQPVSFIGTIQQYGKNTYWGIKVYLPQKIEALASCTWNVDYWKIPVLVSGTEQVFDVNYDGGNTAFDFFTAALKGDPAIGTTFKISAGTYQSEGTVKYNITIDKDYSFKWNGVAWLEEGSASAVSQNVEFAGTINQYATTTYWGFKVNLNEKIETFENATLLWNVDCWEVPVVVSGTEKTFNVNYDGGNTAFDFFNDSLKGNVAKDTTFKIRAGKYLSKSGKYEIELKKDYIFYHDGNEWLYAKYDPDAQVTYNKVSFSEKISTPIFSKIGKYWSFTMNLTGKIARETDYEWDADGFNAKVFINDQPYTAVVNLLGKTGETQTNRFAFKIAGINNGEKAERGTKLTIAKGSYKSRNFGYGIKIDKDYTVYWDGEAWVKELTEVPYYVVAFNGKSAWSGFKDNYWEVTFALTGKIKELADCEWNEDYWKVPVVINGTQVVMNVNYDRSNTRFDFFSTALKNQPAAGSTFRISAGKYMSESGKYGIEFKEDFTFTWDGTTWNGNASTVTGTSTGSSASNNKGNTAGNKQSPSTGDTNVVWLCVLLALFSGAVLTVAVWRKLHKNKEK